MEDSVFNQWVADLRAAIDGAKGDCEMDEPTKWRVEPDAPGLKPMLIRSKTGYYHMGRVDADGCVSVTCSSPERQIFTTDLCGLIASLQSILVLAQEHFGEDWGR